MPGRINGFSLGYTAVGAIILWSGIKGWTISTTFRNLVSGTTPSASTEQISTAVAANTAANAAASGVGATGPAPGAVTSIQNYNTIRLVASTYGWGTGAQWAALTNVVNRESGGSATVQNSSSGALGIAQALGHGTANTAGTLGNEYGGYGVPDATARGANSGNASDQAIWMMAYIKAAYGTPEGAWAHEESAGWY